MDNLNYITGQKPDGHHADVITAPLRALTLFICVTLVVLLSACRSIQVSSESYEENYHVTDADLISPNKSFVSVLLNPEEHIGEPVMLAGIVKPGNYKEGIHYMDSRLYPNKQSYDYRIHVDSIALFFTSKDLHEEVVAKCSNGEWVALSGYLITTTEDYRKTFGHRVRTYRLDEFVYVVSGFKLMKYYGVKS